MWKFGINAALRISDLRLITMDHALTGTNTIKENKTNKRRSIPLNYTAMAVAQLRHWQCLARSICFKLTVTGLRTNQ